jgi:hypothetical protein
MGYTLVLFLRICLAIPQAGIWRCFEKIPAKRRVVCERRVYYEETRGRGPYTGEQVVGRVKLDLHVESMSPFMFLE